MTKKKKPKRPRQRDLEETGAEGYERDPELVELAEKLSDAREARMEAGREEKQFQDELMGKMKELKIEEFQDPEGRFKAKIVHEKEKIQIKKLAGRERHIED